MIVKVVEAAGANTAARKNSPLRDQIVSETASGAKKDRPEFQALKAWSAAGPKHFPTIKSKSPELENPANGQLSGILRIVSMRIVNQILTNPNIRLINGSVSDDVLSVG